MIRTLDITSKEQIEKINRVAANQPFDVWVSTRSTMLDARSLLGLYALIGKRVNIVAEDNVNPVAFDKMVNRMEA